jgi:hypothetical protein
MTVYIPPAFTMLEQAEAFIAIDELTAQVVSVIQSQTANGKTFATFYVAHYLTADVNVMIFNLRAKGYTVDYARQMNAPHMLLIEWHEAA